MLDLRYPIADLKGAEYNPREIGDADLEALKESVTRLGIVKPIIVRGKTIVAGHQRTKALRALGATHAPAFVLKTSTTTYDEVRFNQLHNGTDLDEGAEGVRVTRDLTGVTGFVSIKAHEIAGNFKSRNAVLRKEIAELICKYGGWGGIVATDAGEVIHCAHYALASAMVGYHMTCFVIPVARRAEYMAFLSRQYGVFSYKKLPRQTFIQTFAQMFRLREGAKKGNRSPTYENLVIPFLNGNSKARAIDFGCGQGDYVKSLSKAGADIIGVELFLRHTDRAALDVSGTKRQILRMCDELTTKGQFDAVVCDYVMNSVDCPEAERSVLAVLDMLCRPGGRIFLSGRRRECIEKFARGRAAASHNGNNGVRHIEFIDDGGFTALYRKGRWFYQRFHRVAEVEEIAKRHGWRIVKRIESSTAWNVELAKLESALTVTDYEAAVRFEFDLPINDAGKRLGMADNVMEAVKCLSL